MSNASDPSARGAPQRATPQAILDELASKTSALAQIDAATAGPHWGAMHKLLLKAKVDPSAIGRLVAGRDIAGLQTVVRQLRGEEVAAVSAAPVAPSALVDPDTQRLALRAFRNRLKFTRLDAESKLSPRPMTGGKKNEIDAIIPPREYPLEVWEALTSAGKLRNEGQGFYALTEDHGHAER
ncbi:MAG: hypothetical protein SGJ09_14080 [Phycisphaerae bacterium]|nr:hypothetical protein [Phycisphaerae bacterium]